MHLSSARMRIGSKDCRIDFDACRATLDFSLLPSLGRICAEKNRREGKRRDEVRMETKFVFD